MTDHDIQIELDTYNALVPEPGQLCASLFIELTSDDSMKEWLPRLVGIEHSLAIRLADGRLVRAMPEEAHAAQLTRTDVTSAVHYYRFEFTADEIAGFANGDASLILDHPACPEQTELAPHTIRELLSDLTG